MVCDEKSKCCRVRWVMRGRGRELHVVKIVEGQRQMAQCGADVVVDVMCVPGSIGADQSGRALK